MGRVWWGDLKERGHMEDLTISGKKILKFIIKRRDEKS
jgi:hypothetical protein